MGFRFYLVLVKNRGFGPGSKNRANPTLSTLITNIFRAQTPTYCCTEHPLQIASADWRPSSACQAVARSSAPAWHHFYSEIFSKTCSKLQTHTYKPQKLQPQDIIWLRVGHAITRTYTNNSVLILITVSYTHLTLPTIYSV